MPPVNEWVEVAGPTVEVAVAAALQELGLTSPDEVTVEVIREPSKGILGTAWRAQDAVVKVTPKPQPTKKRRSRSRRSRSSSDRRTSDKTSKDNAERPTSDRQSRQTSKRDRPKVASEAASKLQKSTAGKRSDDKSAGREASSASKDRNQRTSDSKDRGAARGDGGRKETSRRVRDNKPEEASIDEQANVAKEFLTGLLAAFGLEGGVETEIDEDILKINVTGGQTEALVGRKGAIMQAVHEITRTVIQRKTFGAPRMRLDINGYGERRREALRIYSARQAERVLADGGEIMLEPMNPADRKVVHDAIAEIDGVESYSEGEDPERAVVIAPVAKS